MQLRVLGCSGGIGHGRATTSLLINDSVLLDAGTGLCDQGLDALRKIRDVYLTHSHLDHVAGIPLLVDTIFDSLSSPLTVHGRPETLEALRRHVFNGVMWPDFTVIPEPARPALRFAPMAVGERREVAGCDVRSIEVNHAVPAVGYRVDCGGKVLAFSGDTTTNETFWEALNAAPRLELLIVEVAFPEEDLELSRLAHHYCPSTLAADLARLRHRPRIYLTHFKPGAEDRILSQCRAAVPDRDLQPLRPGDCFEI